MAGYAFGSNPPYELTKLDVAVLRRRVRFTGCPTGNARGRQVDDGP